LPDRIPFEQGACLGIAAITAHRCVHAAGPVDGRTVLVQGGAGAVGICAVQLARRAGALVIATVRSAAADDTARRAGAHHVLHGGPGLIDRVRAVAPRGVDHIVEVAFGSNVPTDLEVLTLGGSIATFATDIDAPRIPFWPLLFKNVRVFFVGSDDVPVDAKRAAAVAVTDALAEGWTGFDIAERWPLEAIATAHEHIEQLSGRGRIVLTL
jgi:NADPH:quinone reductase